MAYKDLSLKERHAIIRESVSRGIHRLSDIEAMYDASHAMPEQQIAVAPIEATPQEAEINTQPNLLAEGGGIHIAPSNPLIGKKYYKDGGVLEGDFDVDALTYEEIKELDRLGYTVERL